MEESGWVDLGRLWESSQDINLNTWTSNTTTSSALWGTNMSTATTGNYPYRINNVSTVSLAPVPEDRLRSHQQTLASQREDRRVARVTARNRAEELLLSLLNEEQRETYRLTGSFDVIGSAGGHYVIERGTSGNVVWIDPSGQPAARLCAHPDMRERWMPDQDIALGQLLALRHDEAAFIRLANVHAGRRPDHLVVA